MCYDLKFTLTNVVQLMKWWAKKKEKKNQDALFAPEVVRGQGLCRTSSAVAFVRLSQHLLSSLHCCSVCQENGKQENSAWIAFWKNK